MTQLVPFNQMQAPAHLSQYAIAPDMIKQMNAAAALGTGGGGSVPKISLKQSRFRLITGNGETVLPQLELQVALLRVNDGINKTWFEKAWNPNDEPTLPECSSDDGVTPRADSQKRQSNDCASCPHNQWGSSINPVTGKKGKSCQDSKRMALVGSPNGRFDSPNSEVYQLAIPPASLGDFGGFISKLSQGSVPAAYNMVVVSVAFDTTVSYPKLNFQAVRWLEADEYAAVSARYNDPEVKRIAGLPDAQTMHVGTVGQVAHQPAGQQPVQQQVQQQPQQFAQQQPQQFAQQQQPVQQQVQQPVQQPQQSAQQQPVQQQQFTQQQPAQQQQFTQQPQQFEQAQQPVQQAQQFAQPQQFTQQQPQQFEQQPQQFTQQQPVAEQASQQPQAGGPVRERGKPSPGKARRNAQEIADDKAADEADAARATGQAQVQAQSQQVPVHQFTQQPQQFEQQPQQFAQQQQPVQQQQFAQPQQFEQQPQQFAQQPVQQAQQFDSSQPFAGAQQAVQTGAPNQPGVVSGDALGGLAGWDDPV